MTLEAKIDELIDVSKKILVALQSGASVGSAAAPAKEPAKAATTTKAADTKAADPKTDTKATDGVPFKEVMDAVMAVNKSNKPGHGRDGVMAILKQFNLAEGKKVPDLEALGKNADIKAFAEKLLKGEPAAETAGDDALFG